ncbi:MAG: N-acetyl-1-D-myo-inositol-2-amino-2-deoxy-alpha-D-glucopyranoside deacetylase [Chloroflexi bacterium]|nr:N-acetyl-1-D-myo-inositol-2-amino-2-deoxy-alpha-D-glucopyranoside deacetylase [Chloroflexota bacterium]
MSLRLMAVHPHPDDETIATGGTLARYVAEGAEVVLVTCTLGEVGEISDPALASPENLSQVRAAELAAACAILGVREHHVLGYRDSGMAGTPDNDHPASFHRADLDEAAGRLVALIRRFRPQVVVGDNEHGTYGHPDHIKANRVTVAAFHAAGDPARYPEHGLDPWQPLKLYFTAVPRSRFAAMAPRMAELGLPVPEQRPDTVERPFGTPDELVTTALDVSAYAPTKHRALHAHRTQLGTLGFFTAIPLEHWPEFFGTEYFQRVACLVSAPDREHDLFAGLRSSI